MPPRLLRAALALATAVVHGMNNGLARKPAMGWNSWNWVGARDDCDAEPYRCLNEQNMRAFADALVSSGMAAAGYDIVNLSESWPAQERAANGSLVPDPTRFPSGIPALSEYIHSKGLRFGIYLDMGVRTCAGFPGSQGYEAADVAQIAAWRAEYLWLDGCNYNGSAADMVAAYAAWGALLNGSALPPIWEASLPAYHPPPVCNLNDVTSYSHEFRFYEDIRADWAEIMDIVDYTIDNNILQYTRPGQYPLLDMMEVGNPPLTTAESRAHFSLWAMFAQPLHAGNDIRNMTADVAAILTNAEVIAVDQDPLVRPGWLVARVNGTNSSNSASNGCSMRNTGGTSCPVWNVTTGGYNETCAGPAGNIYCFTNTTLAEANATCCADAECAGFSFDASNDSGCYKRDMECAFQPLPSYSGYSKPGFVPAPTGDIYARLLSDASVAVLFLNRGSAANMSMCVTWDAVGLNPSETAVVRDLWAHATVTGPATQGGFCAPAVPPHDVVMIRVQQ